MVLIPLLWIFLAWSVAVSLQRTWRSANSEPVHSAEAMSQQFRAALAACEKVPQLSQNKIPVSKNVCIMLQNCNKPLNFM